MSEPFNIIATVGTSETDLAPYPGGSSTTPTGKTRKIYVAILTNTSTDSNTLTLNIYKDESLEASFSIIISSSTSLVMISEKQPILLIPSGRTLKAVASAENVDVLMTGVDE
jgi:ribonucleotide monophosphatase NagD (HAD superfamily)